MKRILAVAVCLAAAVLAVVLFPFSSSWSQEGHSSAGMITQEIVSVRTSPVTVYPVYHNGELVGILNSRQKLESFLKKIYRERYEESFPDSEVYLGTDVYMTKEESLFVYSDADDEILGYLEANDLFSLEATAVSFADDTDVYARIYVTDQKLYEDAMNTYISYFIEGENLADITNNQTLPALTTYGSRDTGIRISQTITTSREYASPDEIMTTEEEVLKYLEYGDNTELEYYTVEEYDTVAGVGSKNHGLSATQIMNINRDVISNVDQALTVGQKLCVTYFTSPIDIIVTKESLRARPVYYDTSYVEDENLYVGESEVKQDGVNGSRNVLYEEMWINGVLMTGTELSSIQVTEPVTEVVALGVTTLPDVGTGDFRWPVDNPAITCNFYCYYNHRGTDIINQYDSYGNIYAADTGVVEETGYNYVNGNYIRINHNNGIHTYYGHMNVPAYVAEGAVVRKGDLIGQIGMTGLATGPHVHFGVQDDEENILDACDGFFACETVPGG